jgi:hypothetical protein
MFGLEAEWIHTESVSGNEGTGTQFYHLKVFPPEVHPNRDYR